jgi:hypothetical protein
MGIVRCQPQTSADQSRPTIGPLADGNLSPAKIHVSAASRAFPRIEARRNAQSAALGRNRRSASAVSSIARKSCFGGMMIFFFSRSSE